MTVQGAIRRTVAAGAALLVAATLGVATAPAASAAPSYPPGTSSAPASMEEISPPAAAALVGTDFIPGNIISDQLFYDSDSMTTAQIQAFLNSMHGPCTNGMCLNVLHVTVPTVALTASYSDTTGNLKCSAMSGGSVTAAELIHRTQVACGISAKVILVTLQKEQGLITKTAPSSSALTYAMGMACPDTAACASYAAGFANQIYYGTRQLITYKVSHFSKQPGTNTIRYSPNAACGSSTFTIQNYATAALYAYTPYRPNAAALANLSGTGDGCSSYGNRNFWVYYSSWFGSTHPGVPTVSADTTLGEPATYLLANNFDGNLWLYPRLADNSGWQARSQAGAGWGGMTAVFGAGDFDGDGIDDVMARDGAGDLWLYPRDGAGGWLARKKIGSSWNQFDQIFSAGDFTGDGVPDVLARDQTGGLFLYAGNGVGGWKPSVRLGGGWGAYQPSAAGDFNGDGHADVFAIDTAGKLWLYPGNGRGGLLPRIAVSGTWGGFTALFGGVDLNHDGKIDMIARDGSTGILWLYPGNGVGGITAGVTLGGGWDQFSGISPPHVISAGGLSTAPIGPTSTAPGDLSGDGKTDLIARDATGALWLYPGTGTGSVSPRVKLSAAWKTFTALFGVGDFDGDGKPDLMGRDTTGALILAPSGAGTWLPRVTVATGWGGFTSVFPGGDVNGDGHPDLFALDSAGVLHLYPGDGHGHLLAAVTLNGGWGTYKISSAGDFNGDGREDVFAVDSAGKLWLYPGNVAGNGWQPRVAIAGTWSSFAAIFGGTDLTGDGKADLVARDPAGTMWLYPGTGAATVGTRVSLGDFWDTVSLISPAGVFPVPTRDTTPPVTPGTGITGPGVGDFDGDGHRDVIARDTTGALFLYKGNGAGGWSLPRVQIPGDWKGYTSLFGVGDFNGDGHPDIMGRDAAGALWLVDSDGHGVLAPRVQVGAGWAAFTTVLAGGDFNGDGYPDVLARDSGGALWLYPGNGSGGWLSSVRLGTGWSPYAIFATGDFSGDGHGDLIARDASGVAWLYKGTGTGFSGRTQLSSGWGSYTAMFASPDFTGDNKPDVFVRNSAGALAVLPGTGTGGLLPALVLGNGWNQFNWLG